MKKFTLGQDVAHAADPVLWARDRLGLILDPWQVEFVRSEARQTILNCSRQAGKSTSTAVKALHGAIYNEGLTLLISPTQRQSAILFGKVSEFLRRLQPSVRLETDNRLSCTLSNGSEIVSLPGNSSTIRGYSGPSCVIIDEAAFVDDDVYTSIRPMLAVSRGQLILLSTPHGKQGFFWDTYINGGSTWRRFRVTASQCPRIDPGWLREERASIGDWRFRQEYMCEFVETVDQLFSHELIRSAFSDALSPLFSSEEIEAFT